MKPGLRPQPLCDRQSSMRARVRSDSDKHDWGCGRYEEQQAMSRFIFATVLSVAILTAAVSHAEPKKNTDGQQIFRFDTFGDEQLWTDTLQMHKVLPNVTPRTALSVGLKVDSGALPRPLTDAIKAGHGNVGDPAVTLQLLTLDAVLGVMGKVVSNGKRLVSVGITCALCRTQVDNSVAAG